MDGARRGEPHPQTAEFAPDLIVVVGAARSGTTLLRLLLDAHAEIGCPAEAGIPNLVSNLCRVWGTIDADLLDDQLRDPLATQEAGPDGTGRTETNGGTNRLEDPRLLELPAKAKAAVRDAALAPMLHYCQREGKRIYCDKSLDSVHHVDVVHQIFPEARYVLLFRHVMDTVVSGIEASPWGFQAYGYLPFVQRSPDNFVAAIFTYWLSHVDAALRWQEAHPKLCHRVRYEDLVTDPADVMANVCEFLGVTHDPAALERAFARARSAKGPGDYKVTFTSAIEAASIGRGKRVPVAMVPPTLLEAANEKLKTLGYAPLDRAWNAEPTLRNGRKPDVSGWPARLTELMDRAGVSALTQNRALDSFALVADDDDSARWVVDLATGEIRRGDGEVECVITGTCEDLALLISGQVNAGMLLRSGRIRHLTAYENADAFDVTRTIQLVLEALGDGRGQCDRTSVLPR